MVNWKDKSILKSDIISKVWLNKKDYKYLDFNFKYLPETNKRWIRSSFEIEVYNFKTKILKLAVWERIGSKKEVGLKERFEFEIDYFNPQTDNDCNSINHIIAVCKEYSIEQHKDLGNCALINNQFVYRKSRNFYSYTKIWERGNIEKDNYNQALSYEFATDEYVNYIKHIFKIKKIQRRTIKKKFKLYLDKVLLLERLKK